ncbi:DHH family phosphoesterase [Vibrio mediterranei]|nr:DHH family phosphoesterase [Vibrio mediterranei]
MADNEMKAKTHYDVFNGDADGILSLLQLRLAQPKETQLISGIKRDIALLQRVPVAEAGSVTVLDISMDKNQNALNELLDHNVPITYIDHHKASTIPHSDILDAHIDLDANTCTALIVDKLLQGQYRTWAIAAAYGDNMLSSAEHLANELKLTHEQRHFLKQLGTLVNYNGYGESLADLHFDPVILYQALLAYPDPFDCQKDASSPYYTLKSAFESDEIALEGTETVFESDILKVVKLPATPAARRMSGTWINRLANEAPDQAHISLVPRSGSSKSASYTVSVRAPLNNKQGAAEICSQFATGGGREAAGGINELPEHEVERLIQVAQECYS